jgi:hypothetical protein
MFWPSAATAVVPGANGKIAFSSNRDGNFQIYTMNPDGSSLTRVTNDPETDYEPAWSPDGSKIAYTGDATDAATSDIFVVSASGGTPTNLTNNNLIDDHSPTWSPDGRKIAFLSTACPVCQFGIFVMDADGSGRTQLTDTTAGDFDPAWSPDGSKIAFGSYRDGNAEIYVMNADGSQQTRLTNTPSVDEDEPAWSPSGTQLAVRAIPVGGGHCNIKVMDAAGGTPTTLPVVGCDDPAWSPDGTQILFSSNGGLPGDIYTTNLNGSFVMNLTQSAAQEGTPDWQAVPLPPPPPPGHEPPQNVIPPSFAVESTGVPNKRTLTADPGIWAGTEPLSFTYQWQSCDVGSGVHGCNDIPGATTQSITVGLSEEIGPSYQLVVRASNVAGSAVAFSGPSLVAAPPTNLTRPHITGLPIIGQTLQSTYGDWIDVVSTTGGPPSPNLALQWQRCDDQGSNCTDIPGATASTVTPFNATADYTLTDSDVGFRIRSLVEGRGVTAASDPTAPITPANTAPPPPPPPPPPTLSGVTELLADGAVALVEQSGLTHRLSADPPLLQQLVELVGSQITVFGAVVRIDILNTPIKVDDFRVEPGGALDGEPVTVSGTPRRIADGAVIIDDRFGQGHRLRPTAAVSQAMIDAVVGRGVVVHGQADVTNAASRTDWPIDVVAIEPD